MGTDRYGRIVGIVAVDCKNISQEMVATGLGWWYRQCAKEDTVLQRIEQQAKAYSLHTSGS